MTMQDFILGCMQCYKGACTYLTEIEDAFDVELTESDVKEGTIFACERVKAGIDKNMQLGNALIVCMFDKINNKAQEQYPQYAKQIRGLFGYYAEDYASSLTFDDVQVNSWDELCQEIEYWIART